jgi:hypothetical protein
MAQMTFSGNHRPKSSQGRSKMLSKTRRAKPIIQAIGPSRLNQNQVDHARRIQRDGGQSAQERAWKAMFDKNQAMPGRRESSNHRPSERGILFGCMSLADY